MQGQWNELQRTETNNAWILCQMSFREVECFIMECGGYFLFYSIVFGLSSKAAKNNNHEYVVDTFFRYLLDESWFNYFVLVINVLMHWLIHDFSTGETGGWRCPGCQNIAQEIPAVYKCFCGTEMTCLVIFNLVTSYS